MKQKTGYPHARRQWLPMILLALNACAVGTHKPDPVTDDQTGCTEPRPQVCTMDYTPVCASLPDNERKTYANGCGACADARVKSYRIGACE